MFAIGKSSSKSASVHDPLLQGKGLLGDLQCFPLFEQEAQGFFVSKTQWTEQSMNKQKTSFGVRGSRQNSFLFAVFTMTNASFFLSVAENVSKAVAVT